MENLPLCPQDCLSSGDLLSCELVDNNCYCSEAILYPINDCIRTRCTSSDLDVFNAYIFGACGVVDYGATAKASATSKEGIATSGTKTLSMFTPEPTTFSTLTSTSSSESTTTSSTPGISKTQSSPSSTSTSAPPPSPRAQSSRQTSIATPAKAGIAVGSAAGAVLLIAILLFLFRRHRRNKRIAKGQLAVLPLSSHQNHNSAGVAGLPGGGRVELAGSEAVAGTRLGAREKAELPVVEAASRTKEDVKEVKENENKNEEQPAKSAELDGTGREEAEIYELASP